MPLNGRPFVTCGVATILLVFFSIPLFFILYGGGARAIEGAMILTPLVAVQWLVLRFFQRCFPRAKAPDENHSQE